MLMFLFRSMIVVSFVQDDSNESILSCRFWVFDALKPEFMIDIPIEENKVKEMIFLLDLAEQIKI